MELSIRLEAIAEKVKPGCRLADIGTDHGYLPIELVRRGVCQRSLACDVRKGPLERAAQHIREAGLMDRIETRISNGLEQIESSEIDGAVIAGMGGRLISDILVAESRRPKNILREISQLILQPQSELEVVRKTVHRLSFQIESEAMVTDRDKDYWILVCRPGEEAYEQEWQYRYGAYLAKKQDPVFFAYIKRQLEKKTALLESLEGSSSEAADRRRRELIMELSELREVLELCQ